MKKNTILALIMFSIPALLLIAKAWLNFQPGEIGFSYDALVLLTLFTIINMFYISFGYEFLERFISKEKFKLKWVILNIVIISVAIVLISAFFLAFVLNSLPFFSIKYIYLLSPMALMGVVYSIPSMAVWLFFRKVT